MADNPPLEMAHELRAMLDLKVFEVDDGGATAHVITNDPQKAMDLAKEALGYEDGPPAVKELPMSEVLSIWMENGRISDGGELVPLTCAEWITRQGEGFLCTSEF